MENRRAGLGGGGGGGVPWDGGRQPSASQPVSGAERSVLDALKEDAREVQRAL